MDVDPSSMDPHDHPQAGPSRLPTPPPPPIYFPPFPQPQPSPVSGSQDLLTRYRLFPYYQHFARPFVVPVSQQPPLPPDRKRKRDAGKEVKFVGIVEPVMPGGTPRGGTPVGLRREEGAGETVAEGKGKEREREVKIEESAPEVLGGKGKERERSKEKTKEKGKDRQAASTALSPTIPTTPGGGKLKPGKLKRDKNVPKRKSGYRHYLWGLKGRVNTKKDKFLTNLISAPPKQPLRVKPFEAKTVREAFKLQEGVLPDYDPLRYTDSPLISEKKKRKLAEKAARLAARERAKASRAGGTQANPSTAGAPSTTTSLAPSQPTLSHPTTQSTTVHVPAGGGVPTPATTSAGTPPATPGSPLPGANSAAAGGGARKIVGGSGLKNSHLPPPGSPSNRSLSTGSSPFPRKVASPLPPGISSPLRPGATTHAGVGNAAPSAGRQSGSAAAPSHPHSQQPRAGGIPGKPLAKPGGGTGAGLGEKRKEPPDRGEAERERDHQRAVKAAGAGAGIGVPGVGKGGKKRKINGAKA